jgi:hypothetical protein
MTQLNWDELGVFFTSQNELMDDYFTMQRDMVRRQSFLSNIYRWCLENSVPIHSSRRHSLLVVFYEELVKRPCEELHRIQLFLQRESPGHWKEWIPDLKEIDRPSVTGSIYRTSSRGSKEPRIDWWQREVPPELVSVGLEVVAGFGLDWLYGGAPMPRVSPDDLPVGPV